MARAKNKPVQKVHRLQTRTERVAALIEWEKRRAKRGQPPIKYLQDQIEEARRDGFVDPATGEAQERLMIEVPHVDLQGAVEMLEQVRLDLSSVGPTAPRAIHLALNEISTNVGRAIQKVHRHLDIPF